MILKKYRFHGYNSLRHVYTTGKTVRAGSMALRISPNPHRTDYRLAIVVSKKVSKSAVKRNRMRRRLYEIVRGYEPQMIAQLDMVLTVFEDAVATMPADELNGLVSKLLKDAKIIAKN